LFGFAYFTTDPETVDCFLNFFFGLYFRYRQNQVERRKSSDPLQESFKILPRTGSNRYPRYMPCFFRKWIRYFYFCILFYLSYLGGRQHKWVLISQSMTA
jgi:hypothetical protein